VVCGTFKCSWLYGHGSDADRPDLIGAMFAINQTPSGHIHFAIETQPDALKTSAKGMAVFCAQTLPIPIIAVKHGTEYPNDTGDWIVVRDEMAESWKRNVGEPIERLADDVGMYELRRGA
jgi:hypothetical protein